MTTSAPLSGTELALVRRLRATAAARCARTRMQPQRRDLLRDALVTEAERTWSEDVHATVVHFPHQRTGRGLQHASA